MRLTKHVLRDMVARGEGRVLFTSSIGADMPAPFEAVYAASRAFAQSLAQALRNEVKDTAVTITALQPGPTDTNFFHRAGMDDTKVGAGAFRNELQDTMAKLSPEPVTAEMHRHLSEPDSANQ